MNAEIKDKKEVEVKEVFPKLVCYKEDGVIERVVLVTDKIHNQYYTGTLVYDKTPKEEGEYQEGVGYTTNMWMVKFFKDFEGEVVLSN